MEEKSTWQTKCSNASLPLISPQPLSSSSSSQQQQQQVHDSLQQRNHVIGPESRAGMAGLMPEYSSPNIPYLNRADYGSSFLGLLAGPASHLQYNLHALSNPRSLSRKLHMESCDTAIGRTHGQVAPASRASFGSFQKLRNVADLHQVCLSREPGDTSSSFMNFALENGFHDKRSVSCESDLDNAVICHADAVNEQAKHSPHLMGERLGANPNLDPNSQLLQVVSEEAKSSISRNLSTLATGCPQVFCLNTSGHLLLSNTGLLGILCSCHCFHMSVSKFCEHSGLSNVISPGNVVCMDTGETIAQWRKLYFQKFGIMVLEDQKGWDWPEGLSLTARLANSFMSSSSMSNKSKNNQFPGQSGGSVKAGRSLQNINSVMNPLANQRSIIDACMKQKKDANVPEFVSRTPEGDHQSVSRYIDAVVSDRSLSSMDHSLQNASDISRLDKGETSTSDLRLGQPFWRSQSSGHSVGSGAPFLHDVLTGFRKQSSQDSMAHRAKFCGRGGDSTQFSHASGIPDLTRRVAQGILNCSSHATGSVTDGNKIEVIKGDLARNSAANQFTCFNTAFMANSHSKTTSNVVKFREQIIPETLHTQSNLVGYNPVSVTWLGGNDLESRSAAIDSGFFKPAEKSQGVGYVTGNLNAKSGSDSKLHNALEKSCPFTVIQGGNGTPGFPVRPDKNFYSHHLSNVVPCDVENYSICHKKSQFGGCSCIDNRVGGSVPSFSGQHFSSQADSDLSKLSASLGKAHTFSKDEGIKAKPYLLDDDPRLLALRQILELSEERHATPSLKNLEQESCSVPNFRVPSIFEPLTSGIQMGRLDPMRKGGISEASMTGFSGMQIGGLNSTGKGDISDASMAGLNDQCNFSTLTQGMPFLSKEVDNQHKLPRDPPQVEQSFFRLCREETDTRCPNEHTIWGEGKLFFGGDSSCTAKKRSSIGYCRLRGESSAIFSKNIPTVHDKAKCSQFVIENIVPKDTDVSLVHHGTLDEQLVNNKNNASCHVSQWKDVPCKVKDVPEVETVKQSDDLLIRKESKSGRLDDNAADCSSKTVHMGECKELELSDISSGCSAPVVTQASIEVNKDCSAVVDDNTAYVDNLVDEGSGIDKGCSSDGALESVGTNLCGSTWKTGLRREQFGELGEKESRCLLDEAKLMDSLLWKKGQNQMKPGDEIDGRANHAQESEMGMKTVKRKGELTLKIANASFECEGPVVCCKYPKPKHGKVLAHCCSSKGMQTISSSRENAGASSACTFKPISKRGKTVSLQSLLSHKSGPHRLYDERRADDFGTYSHEDTRTCNTRGISARKKLKCAGTSTSFIQLKAQEPTGGDGEMVLDDNPVSCIKQSSIRVLNDLCARVRPVVCGEYGEITNSKNAEDASKAFKIVSLDSVLRNARKFALPRSRKPRSTCMTNLKRKSIGRSSARLHKRFKKRRKDRSNGLVWDEFSLTEKQRDDTTGKRFECLETPEASANGQWKPKFKETQKRNLYELTSKGIQSSSQILFNKDTSEFTQKTELQKVFKSSEYDEADMHVLHDVDDKRYIQLPKQLPESDSYCCVCGSSNKDELNCLLECQKCSIKVHLACYGVARVPKGHWYCRPCRTNSKDMVCVLCGYGSGAMTRALRSRTISKSLLKAWNLETDSKLKSAIAHSELIKLETGGFFLGKELSPHIKPMNMEPSTSTVQNMNMENEADTYPSLFPRSNNLKVHNSITAGVVDSTVKQWVHMVCGLWTPSTRCPNVATMSAFDVSGVRHRANVVCSICNRPGGSCIQCRVVNCYVQFHPWCAHQQGLLQSEAEGVDEENVGFYGRCIFHAMYAIAANDASNSETSCLGEKETSCARTEGYKGRKRNGFWHNFNGQSRGKGGFHVPQEQLDAWILITGQKSCTQGFPKRPTSMAEQDCRKEYARYKQTKGWKRLVVYRSGIHALGLYTSQFIYCGEMVVEYVGEIVGLRVADERENEYQAGKKLQYKSACYFFRIDKEHIIDATRKGGIARFVNHSCLPNCVAKVIVIRNEKKVVFFAERDIYPGEEITYDYHFNHEDEGKKIPCFCNSKNCRRYLN